MAPTSRTFLIPFALRAASARGVHVAALIERFGFPTTITTMQQVVLPIVAQGEVLEAIEQATNDPLFGVRLARAHPRGELGLIEYVFRTAPSVGDGLAALARFSAMANSAVSFQIEHSATELVLHHITSLGRQWNEWLFAFLVAQLREMVVSGVSPRAVRFVHARHEQHRQVAEFFGCRLAFDAEDNQLVFSVTDANRKLQSADPVLHDLLVELAEQKHIEHTAASPWTLQVREAVRQELPQRLLTLEATARRLGKPARWLQRTLAAEHTHYNEILLAVRMDAARRLLRGPKTVLEIALDLHYSDATALARAFRRMTGMTPARFRGLDD
jgi:AraC-like DNA-binding protein